jgi:hypothetical protein
VAVTSRAKQDFPRECRESLDAVRGIAAQADRFAEFIGSPAAKLPLTTQYACGVRAMLHLRSE